MHAKLNLTTQNMIKPMLRKLFSPATALILLMLAIMPLALAANGRTVVVFTASWCASCREVVPIVQEIASQNGLQTQLVDVDSQDASKQVRNYGLSIPQKNLPQAFLVGGGNAVLLFDGQNYIYGQSDMARSTVLKNLQTGLGVGASGK